jgi:hypothetical protein
VITHIHKLLLTETTPNEFTTQVAQVSAMPMSVPAAMGIQINDAASITIWWRWLPGEETNHIRFNNSCPLIRVVDTLRRRLADTKPWSLEAPKVPHNEL